MEEENSAPSSPQPPVSGTATAPHSPPSDSPNFSPESAALLLYLLSTSFDNLLQSTVRNLEKQLYDEARRHGLVDDTNIRGWIPKRICVPIPGEISGNIPQELHLQTYTGQLRKMKVYSLGTFKMELCDEWQESGSCRLGDHCNFAHGILELRPHYRTEACTHDPDGIACPCGNICLLRHYLTEEEKNK